jgi:hypothetical protein
VTNDDDWGVELAGIGTAGNYFPYDIEDWRAPKKKKRAPGFVTEKDYVTKAGIVKRRKHKKKKR